MLKTVSVASALAAFGVFSAHAADLPVKALIYVKAPVAIPYNWSGFYLGLNAGGSVGRSRTNARDVNVPPFENETTYLSAAGAIGGGQVGYNLQVPSFFNMVFGVEADIQGSSERATACIRECLTTGTFTLNLNQKIDWFGTVRGRVGLATGPVLSYVTGGYAYGDVSTSGSLVGSTLPGVPFAVDQTRGGFVLGSGVEASLGGNWTGKIEYLYLDLGTQSAVVSTTGNAAAGILGNPVTVSSHIRDNIFRGGVNYAFNGNSNYHAPVANWSGLYVGANAGSLTARNQSGYVGGLPSTTNMKTFDLAPDGYEGGVQIGYNWQSAAWVYGVEADIMGASAKDDRTCIFGCSPGALVVAFNQTTPYLGTLRGRLGYSVGSTLFYGTAGVAYGETKTAIQIPGTPGISPDTLVTFKHAKSGYAVGAGMESPLSLFGLFGPAWTIKSEYLFVDLGSTSDTFVSAALPSVDTFTTRTQEHIFRTGINYHFNAPVVAKY